MLYGPPFHGPRILICLVLKLLHRTVRFQRSRSHNLDKFVTFGIATDVANEFDISDLTDLAKTVLHLLFGNSVAEIGHTNLVGLRAERSDYGIAKDTEHTKISL